MENKSIPRHSHPPIDFGRHTCGDLSAAEQLEWLVTNGIGGFASGTVAGTLTRRYHGLLIAALRPPLGRNLLVAALQEVATYDEKVYSLGASRWGDGTVTPQGYQHIERFSIEGTTPVWTFALGDAQIEKRIWMEVGANTTYIEYRFVRGCRPVALEVKALVNYREYHSNTHAGEWQMRVETVEHGLRVTAFDGATPIHLLGTGLGISSAHEWYRNFGLAAEGERGLDASEDHLHVGTFHGVLHPHKSITIVCSTEDKCDLDGPKAYQSNVAHQEGVVARWLGAGHGVAYMAPSWINQLVLAADQFVVRRPLRDDPDARSLIAGYHWFGDWGRDTMIALPGIALATGRPDVAQSILRNFARFVDQGMLPNILPDALEKPEYNTADATLWYFEAVRQHIENTRDVAFLREIYPVLTEIIDWHIRGTRYNIHVDPADGLLYAGNAGVQLTWMDAKVGDWVVTPRIGKPIEINALWLNALITMTQFADTLGQPSESYAAMAKRAREGFQRFWNEAEGCCFDVLDGPTGNDSSLRPNQLLAVSLPESPLTPEQQRAVVDICARHLLTSHGLRSLAPKDPSYRGFYGGGSHDRDSSYHQGTVWGWLLGPFVLAHYRVHGDAVLAASFLEPMANHIAAQGLGTASEIFDGDEPFAPRGCIAQAWTVGEILRAWTSMISAASSEEGKASTRKL
jgi:predicted glycogen debranching enzyme